MTPSRFLSWVLDPHSPATADWSTDTGPSLHWLAPGVLQLGPQSGHSASDAVLLSCGIHGNETAPIELIDALLQDIAQGRLILRCQLLVIFGHPAAMRQGDRYLDYDLNRLFHGAHQQQNHAAEASRAALLEQAALAFFAPATGRRLHYDLHTAIRASAFEKFAICPYRHQRPYNLTQFSWLKCSGINAILLHQQAGHTFSYFTSQTCQAESFTLELGKARPFGQNDLSRFADIDHALRQLISGQTPALSDFQNGDIPLFQSKYDLTKHSEAFVLHLADDVANFTALADGQLIAEDGAQRYIAQGGQERILFPNPKVKPGLRAGIVVEPVQLPLV